jgi:hypothetical protein
MPHRDHVPQIAPEQPAIDQEERDRGADPGHQQHDIDRQHQQVDDHHAGSRADADRETPADADPPGAREGVRIVARLDRSDDFVGEDANHRDRNGAERQPQRKQRDEQCRQRRDPAARAVAEPPANRRVNPEP